MNEILPSISVAALVERRNSALNLRLASFEAWQESEKHMGNLPSIFQHRYEHVGYDHYTTPEKIRQSIDSAFWLHLFNNSSLPTIMTASKIQQFHESLEKGPVPAFEPETITATFADLFARKYDFLYESVESLFRRLSWNYKSNLPQMFGDKIVYAHFFRVYTFKTKSYYADPDTCRIFEDLERILSLLDKRSDPPNRDIYARSTAGINSNMAFETDYLRFKLFKNGNAHVYFKRPELTTILNEILSERIPNALPPAR